jgi:hypothetical protein
MPFQNVAKFRTSAAAASGGEAEPQAGLGEPGPLRPQAASGGRAILAAITGMPGQPASECLGRRGGPAIIRHDHGIMIVHGESIRDSALSGGPCPGR